jgi:hypothetical protein
MGFLHRLLTGIVSASVTFIKLISVKGLYLDISDPALQSEPKSTLVPIPYYIESLDGFDSDGELSYYWQRTTEGTLTCNRRDFIIPERTCASCVEAEVCADSMGMLPCEDYSTPDEYDEVVRGHRHGGEGQ